jgi:ParB-like chromosome segregation protein Spo0J
MNKGGSNPPGAGDALNGALWPASVSEKWPISKLQLRSTNPRSHSLEQIEQICASMKRFGWTIPVLIDEEGVILAGHGRVRAARLMGFAEAPVVIARGWSEDEKRAYVIADNQLAANSEWDPKQLRGELRALVASEFDMTLIGISDEDLSKLVIDPKAKEDEEGTEDVEMTRCKACGSLRRKTDS